jgi:DNA repair protein SbcC/Rad50
MRPTRIRLEGFSAYREPAEVDFTEADFFSLTGPTGSGKSSLIDAMIFALFGRVPRLGGNAVAPAITAGSDRARVEFEFEVDDGSYKAVRLAQRTTSGGATVKEARLERGDQVLADGADDVTREIESLLRLRFDDFTRTVVLPQGDFARFLTATKAERQGLLRNLLGLDVYTRVRELAKTRSAVAGERVGADRRSLEALEVPDEETRRLARERRDAIDRLADRLPGLEKELERLTAAMMSAEVEETATRERLARLEAIEVPERLEELDALVVEARSSLADAEASHAEAQEKVTTLESVSAGLPTLDQIASWDRTRSRLGEIDQRLSGAGLEEVGNEVAGTSERVAKAVTRLEEARESLSQARSAHAAHALAGSLNEGEPCPVCLRPVTEIPEQGDLPLVGGLEEVASAAAADLESERRLHDEARARLSGVEATVAELTTQRAQLESELVDAPSSEEIVELRARIEGTSQSLIAAREALVTARNRVDTARGALEALADDSRRAAKRLTTAQLSVADLDPPVSESDDVIVQWKDLISWRETTRVVLQERATESAEAKTAAIAAVVTARETITTELSGLGLDAVEPYAVQVATALHAARAVVSSNDEAIEKSERLIARISESETDVAVADALAGHLRANGFEQWLMAGALSELVDGANDLLDQLSGGGYSLDSDDSGSFGIVDHRNADETRRVETLSGGETFLVSLALALSLAETLAAKGGSGLDAIILDEGFGTLDDESLDTVAGVLEELSGKGLMVGVITHVKELASRAPVRFEVVREPGGARVRRAS